MLSKLAQNRNLQCFQGVTAFNTLQTRDKDPENTPMLSKLRFRISKSSYMHNPFIFNEIGNFAYANLDTYEGSV